jgi:synaptic vesicle membrane protein VAT-1
MRKIVIHAPGGYDRLKLETTPDPVPKTHQVLVAVKFSGINYADVIIRWGLYKSAKEFVGWPITPGFEFSGIVKSVGSGVKRFKVGDEVVGVTLFGGYADRIAVSEDSLYLKPSSWTLEQAAAFPAVFLTAYHALLQNVVIRRGSKILVHSAAGGVGTALLQLCRILGFESVAVVGSTHKIEAAKKMGADHVIDKSKQDLWAEAKRLAPDGYDVVLDANGVSTMQQSWESLALGGKLMIYGFHSMFPREGGMIRWIDYAKLAKDYLRTPRFNPLEMTNANKSVVSFNLSFLWAKREMLSEAVSSLLEWAKEGKLQPPIVTVFKAEDVAGAHAAIESGKSVGKLVLAWD